MELTGVKNMNQIKKSALTAGIVIALFGSVGCAASNSHLQIAANEVFAASESDASDLYQKGQKAMDRGDWKKASSYFTELSNQGTKHTDAALYWKAYSQYRAGKNSSANRVLNRLFKKHPDSQWLNEARALQSEIRGVDRDNDYNDDEMKEIALNSLLHASPERALPILKKTLASTHSDDVKEMALFILSQMGTAEARQLIETLAQDNTAGELQKNAIHMLAISGDSQSREILANLYNKITDPDTREEILTGFMISGDKEKLLQAAKTESNNDLRGTAAELLGQLGAHAELLPLYKNETSPDVKESIISAMMMSGNSSGIEYIIEHEQNVDLLSESIQMLGMMHNNDTTEVLKKLWQDRDNSDVREAIMEAWMLKGDTSSIENIAQNSTSKDEKIQAIEYLGVMKGQTILRKLYSNEQDLEVKEQLIESLMMSGDTEILSEIIENETNADLVEEAIHLAAALGKNDVMDKLNKTYQETSNIEIKQAIIESHMIRHNSDGLIQLLKQESNPQLLETVIEMLGVMGNEATSAALESYYNSTDDLDLKSQIIEAFMIQGNAKLLINIFRTEKDPELKRLAVRNLAVMNTKESQALMLELLDKE